MEMKYKIEQKDFDSLSQLDRIEYRQVKEEIEKEYGWSDLFDNATLLILLTGFMGTFGGYFMNNILLVNGSVLITKIGIVFVVLKLLGNFYGYFKKSKLIEELNKKYFSTSINPKKRK